MNSSRVIVGVNDIHQVQASSVTVVNGLTYKRGNGSFATVASIVSIILEPNELSEFGNLIFFVGVGGGGVGGGGWG